jgi:hypothetical protein
MEYVRLLHPKHFDCQRGEFKSLAFKVYDDGASVIQLACVAGASICQHIRKYYPDVGGDPPVFWIFDEAILPKDCRLAQKRSDSGDDCHFNIISTGSENVLNKALRKLLKSATFEDFSYVQQWTRSPSKARGLVSGRTYRDCPLADRLYQFHIEVT